MILFTHSECGSLGLAIDNTGSGSDYLQILLGLVESLEKVPFWTLTTFNDFSNKIAFEEIASENVDFLVSTDNVDIFKESLIKMNFSGGGSTSDFALRATQGEHDLSKKNPNCIFSGLLLTMQKMHSPGVVVLFTDSPTKNHRLENEIISYGKEKDIDVIVVLALRYKYGQVGDTSWQVYEKVSQERVFEMDTLGFDRLLDNVSQLVGKNCLAGVNISVQKWPLCVTMFFNSQK